MKKISLVIITFFLLGGASAESAIFAKDGKMIFDGQGRLAMNESAAVQALKELGVSARDAAQLTRFITNDSKRAEEIQRLNLKALSGKPQEGRRQGSDEASRAEVRQPRPKSPQPAAARRRSPSPVRTKSPVSEEVNWEELQDFMQSHNRKEDNPVKALEHLGAKDPRAIRRLCNAILHPDFYKRAQSAGIGTIKNRAMVSFCHNYMPERARLKEVQQGGRAPSPVREQVRLRPVELPKPSQDLAAQQKALEEAQRALQENAERLGKKAKFEEQFKAANVKLREAQEWYDNLSVAVMGMKDDLKDIREFERFQEAHHAALPDHYIDALVQFRQSDEGRFIQLTRESNAQIGVIQELLHQAKTHLEEARADLAHINRELMQLL